MWREIPNSEYFLQFTEANNSYEICATDYITIWTTSFSRKAFIAQLKNCNEGLELPSDNDYLKKGIHLFLDLNKLKKIDVKKETTGKNLTISMKKLMGFTFFFNFKLSKGSEEFYFNKITNSLLQTIGDLRASQAQLRRALIKKDKEIEEYKSEGGEIVLRHLKTVPFNDEEHMKKFKCYEENFGSNDLPTRFLKKSNEPELSNIKKESSPAPTVKDESASIKQEPNTPVVDNSQSLIIESVTCKLEEIKPEMPSRKKKTKLNL